VKPNEWKQKQQWSTLQSSHSSKVAERAEGMLCYSVMVDGQGRAYLDIGIGKGICDKAGLQAGDWLSIHHNGDNVLMLARVPQCGHARKLRAGKSGNYFAWQIASTGTVGDIFGGEKIPRQPLKLEHVGEGWVAFSYYAGEEEDPTEEVAGE